MPSKLDRSIHSVFDELDHENKVASSNDRARASLGERGQKVPAWTEDEDQFLRESLGVIPIDKIARKLGRSRSAVKIRFTRQGMQAPSKRSAYYTRRQVADILGIDIHQVCELGALGLLVFEDIPGMEKRRNEMKRIHSSRLRRFVVDPMNWPYFRYRQDKKARKLPHPGYNKLVQLVAARWDDEWWTTGRVAKHFGLTSSGVINRRIRLGILPAIRWGNWYVRKSEALKLTIYAGRGMTNRARRRTRKTALLQNANQKIKTRI